MARARSILAFVNFQREHIRLEETVLFTEIIERVTDEQVAELARLFREFDESAFSHTTLDPVSKIAEDLTRHYSTVRTRLDGTHDRTTVARALLG